MKMLRKKLTLRDFSPSFVENEVKSLSFNDELFFC